MNNRLRCLLALIIAFTLASGCVRAAAVIFTAPVTIAGDSDVATNGTLVFAYNWANASQTVSGVPFAGTAATTSVGADLSMSWLGGGIDNSGAFSAGSEPFSSLSMAYQGLLKGAVYADTSGTATVSTLILNGLLSGRTYLVQIWINDARGGSAGGTRSATITSGGGNTVTLNYGAAAAGAVGQSTTGTFTANSDIQTLTFTATATGNSPTAQLNAIQLRDVTPFPGYHWDPNGNTAGVGGSGGWDTTSTCWTADATGTSDCTVYPNAAGLATAVRFAGPAGTATIPGGTTIHVSSITFAATGYTIGGTDGSASLTDASGTKTLTITTAGAGINATIEAAVTGATSLIKAGAGTLVLGNANTYTGGTVISAGSLSLSHGLASGLRIMPMGDSITYGGSGSNAGYRGYLYSMLAAVAPAFEFSGVSTVNPASLPSGPLDQTHHNGFSSYATLHLSNNLDGLDTQPFATYGGADRDPKGGYWLVGGNGTGRGAEFPDVVLLMVGTNDIYWNTGQINVINYQANLTTLINKILTLRPTARVIVADITPWPAQSANVATINSGVKAVVAALKAQAKQVSEVDMNSAFPSTGLSSDGVHPNDSGYAWMADQWYAAILTATATSQPYNCLPANSTVSLAAGASLLLNGRHQTIAAITGLGTVTSADGVLDLAGDGDFIFDGMIGGTGALLKQGSGTATLTGANTYSGATTITGGKLSINGSLHAASAVTVAAAATLGGTGTVGGSVTLAGTLAPGDVGVGTLATGAATLTGTYLCQLAATDSDQLAVTGNLNLNGATVALSAVAPPTSTSYVIASYTGSLTPLATPLVLTGLGGYVLDTTTAHQIKLIKSDYSTWAPNNGITGQAGAADPDHDGLANACEYALGLNPKHANAAPGTLADGLLSFIKGTQAITNRDVTYVIEASDDLGQSDHWTPVVTQAPPNSAPTISCTFPAGNAKKFARLKVTIQ